MTQQPSRTLVAVLSLVGVVSGLNSARAEGTHAEENGAPGRARSVRTETFRSWDEALATQPPQRVLESAAAHSSSLIQSGHLDAAEHTTKAMQSAASRMPQRDKATHRAKSGVHHRLGTIAAMRGHYDKAHEHFEEARKNAGLGDFPAGVHAAEQAIAGVGRVTRGEERAPLRAVAAPDRAGLGFAVKPASAVQATRKGQ